MTRMCICCKQRVNKCMSNISFYKFPKDDELLKKWLLAINTEKEVFGSLRICSRHFKEDDFRYSLVGSKRFLKREAVPSLYLNGQTEDNQLYNSQNAIPKENQSLGIIDKYIMEVTENELLDITESQVQTGKNDILSYIIGKRDESLEFVSRQGYKSQISERLSSSNSNPDKLEKKRKRYLYDVQWEEISTSSIQAKIYWEVVIGKIMRQKLTLRTLRQKVKRLKKKILELHVQVKDIANTDLQ